jgi:hypothetical protein
MIEEDNEGFGINQYNKLIDDPSSTNAINSSISIELDSLKKVDNLILEINII